MFGRSKSDVELLRASLDGSTQAFEVVVGRYQSLVCAITYSATGDVGRSEELAQETFLRAWTSLGQLQDLGKFRAWLCSIARNTVQNWFRSEKRDVVGRAVPLDVAAEEMSQESGPEETVMIQEQQAVVRQALTQMPEGLREALVLFYREGKSTREVAVLLGLSESAARQRISRARSLLREQVADMVETAIARTRPGQAFTAAVVTAIVGLSLKGSATAVAAGGSLGAASVFSGVAAKVAAVAVSAILLAGGIVGYRQLTRPGEATGRPPAVQAAGQERPEETTSVSAVLEAGAAVGPAETTVAPAGVETAATPEAQIGERDRRAAVPPDAAKLFEFRARGVLSGLVTDLETGAPVRDASVTVRLRRMYTARTDANGFYSIETVNEPGDFRVSLVSQEYVGIPTDDRSSTVHLSPDTETVKHFRLPKACMVDVWVVDANGVGIKDARVVGTLLADARMREINGSPSTRGTDPNGYLLLGGFAPADTDYLITAWHTVDTGTEQRGDHQYARSECDYAPGRVAVRLTDPNVVRQIHLVLDRGQTVYARAEYEDGQPVIDVDFDLRPTWWHCNYLLPQYRTGSDGSLAMKHMTAGAYDVSICLPTGDSGFMSRKVMQAQLPPAEGESLVVRVPGKSPQALASISGSLVFRGEKKPVSVRIEASSSSGRLVHGDVDRKPTGEIADTFVLERLEPGTYTLTFSGPEIEETTLPNVVAPSADLQVELVCVPRPKLRGNVVDARTGAAVKDFRVRIKKLRTLRGSPYVQSNQWVHYENQQGEFSLDTTGPGVYRVQALAEGYAPTWSEPIDTDAPTQAVVALVAGGEISGRVVNERGEPVSGAKVVPLSLAGGAMPDTEDVFVCQDGAVETVDGLFTLRQAPVGVETLKVTHPDYAPQIVPGVLVTADRTTPGIEIVLTPGGVIEGHVYDLLGVPRAGQVLYAQDAMSPDPTMYPEAGRLGQAVADAHGFYRIEHLPRQLCHIKRMNEWQSTGVVCRAVVPRDGQTVRLDLGGLPLVRGRIVFDGLPLAGTRLMVAPAGSPYSGAFLCFAVTDTQGIFTFGGAPPGTYGIHYERPGEQARWLPVGTVTVGNDDVDAGILPAHRSSLFVTLNDAGAVGSWPIQSVSLTTALRLWASPAGVAAPPAKPGDPYTIRHLEPGRYVLNVGRRDQVFWLRWIELDADKSRWDVALDLPAGKASVSGCIRGASARMFVLGREQKDILAVVSPGQNGVYRVERLPAGRYWIGDISSGLYDLPPLAEFSLGEEEDKTLDLDLSATPAGPASFVIVQVVDEGGRRCEAAQVRLEGPRGPAELVYSEDLGRGVGFLTVPGEHTLRVEAPGFGAVVKTLNAKPFDPQLVKPQKVIVCLERR